MEDAEYRGEYSQVHDVFSDDDGANPPKVSSFYAVSLISCKVITRTAHKYLLLFLNIIIILFHRDKNLKSVVLPHLP